MKAAALHTLETDWTAANYQYLLSELETLRLRLRLAAVRLEGAEPAAAAGGAEFFGGNRESHELSARLERRREEVELHLERFRHAGREPALSALCRAFDLNAFERQVIVLALAPALDTSFRGLFGRLQGKANAEAGTCELGIELLCPGVEERASSWQCFDAHSPLRYFRLLGEEGDISADGPLRLAGRVTGYLLGSTAIDEKVLAVLRPAGDARLTRGQEGLADRLGTWIQKRLAEGGWPRINLAGPRDAGRSAIAAQACRLIGLRLEALDLAALLDGSFVLALLERESALAQLAYFLDLTGLDPQSSPEKLLVERLCARLKAPLFLASTVPVETSVPTFVQKLEPPDAKDQLQLWQSAAEPLPLAADVSLEPLVNQFCFGPRSIARAASDARYIAELRGGEALVTQQDLWQSCRQRSSTPMQGLASALPTPFSWEDIVLPPEKERILRDIAFQVGHRRRVYQDWGFGEKLSQACGVSALFTGPSGTGKTMAAQVLSGSLELDLYRIDLANVVNKYIGETEKNLSRVFDAAERSGAVLFFDEADALFGKRSEVRDSHDRYANIQIDYLLQRIEEYSGLAILATNMKSHIDPAFMRRLRFSIEFPLPGRELRRSIWQRCLPGQAPTEGIDFDALARLELSGGSIRNVVVNAAFLAAAEDRPIGMGHLLESAEREYAKEEKLAPREWSAPQPSSKP